MVGGGAAAGALELICAEDSSVRCRAEVDSVDSTPIVVGSVVVELSVEVGELFVCVPHGSINRLSVEGLAGGRLMVMEPELLVGKMLPLSSSVSTAIWSLAFFCHKDSNLASILQESKASSYIQ